MTGTLIVNADDYGRTPGVSSGIRQAHLQGIVSTTTVMINLPGAKDEVRIALDECPLLGLGVHLNLTAGPPCAPHEKVPSLLNTQGQFWDITTLLENPELLDLSQVEIELLAQIHAFLETGAPFDHLDSHNHIVAMNASLWEIYLTLARKFGCGVRPSFPSDVPQEVLINIYPPNALSFARQEAMERLQTSHIPHPDHFLASFFGPGATLDHLLELLRELPPGTCELMCHPGYPDATLLKSSSYANEREIELSLLTHPAARQVVEQLGLRLCTYRDVWNRSTTGS